LEFVGVRTAPARGQAQFTRIDIAEVLWHTRQLTNGYRPRGEPTV
jgi:hypothetical protein